MSISNKTYDVIKWIAQYLLPALGTLYFGIASAWNLPYSEEIIGTLTAIDAFLGIVLGVSAARYKSVINNSYESVFSDEENIVG